MVLTGSSTSDSLAEALKSETLHIITGGLFDVLVPVTWSCL